MTDPERVSGTSDRYAYIEEYTTATKNEEDFSYVPYKDLSLQILKKNESKVIRTRIPASQWERQSYYIYFCNTPMKQLIFFTFSSNYMMHIWWHIYQGILEALPHSYTVLFLSLYTPHEHLYSSKMVPLFWGCSLQIIICALIGLALYADNLTLLFDYVVCGVAFKAPWDRCTNHIYERENKEIHCSKLKDFFDLTKQNKQNGTLIIEENSILYKLNESFFRPPQVLYLDTRFDLRESNNVFSTAYYFWIYYWIIWISTAFFYRNIYKRLLWRVYNIFFCIIFATYLITLIYIEVILYENAEKYMSVDIKEPPMESQKCSDILIATPILHFMHARSKSKVKPGQHSVLFVISTSLFCLFQEIFYLRLEYYATVQAGISFQVYVKEFHPLFYLWPIFLTSFPPFGPLLSKLFFIILFCLEYLTFVIAYQSMVEVIKCEWGHKWWVVSIGFSGAALIYKQVTDLRVRELLRGFANASTIITELVVIYWLYPLGRLIEDINFHYYAQCVTKVRRTLLSVMPIIITFQMCTSLNEIPDIKYIIIPIVPILLGFIYRLRWIYVNKMPLIALLRPLTTWGPQDFITRMFRKQYDQLKFIDSMSERFLSRHMLKKSEPPSYNVGIYYEQDRTRRRSTLYSIDSVE